MPTPGIARVTRLAEEDCAIQFVTLREAAKLNSVSSAIRYSTMALENLDRAVAQLKTNLARELGVERGVLDG